MANLTAIIILACVFLVVFSCSHAGLASARILNPLHRLVLSAVTAILSVLGIVEMFRTPRDASANTSAPANSSTWITTLLIPYATLGIALLFVVLVRFVVGFFSTKRGSEKTLRRNVDRKRRGNKKKL